MKKIKKGEFGYIKFQKKVELIKTLLMLVLSLAIYRLGIFSTGSNQNLLTFVAVLGCLPMAKFAVNFIMFSKAKGCSKDLYDYLTGKNLKPMFYDMYFTSAKKNYQISALECKKKSLILFSEDTNIDPQMVENHLKEILSACGYENITVKLFVDREKFANRLIELNEGEADETDISVLKDNLLSVSL